MLWVELELKICYLSQFWTKNYEKVHQINQKKNYETFTTEFLQYSSVNAKKLSFELSTRFMLSISSILEILLKFLNFLRS